MSWRWKNFSPKEVLSPEGVVQYERGILLIQPILLDTLEEFRSFVGHPLLVNHAQHKYRGYRSPHENYKIVRGETYSFHMQGLAADLSCIQLPIEELHTLALNFPWHGVGFYPQRNFIHVDLRPRLDDKTIVRWTKT